jgi:uncharacterized membrane protein YjfL (UPF0719 family)
MQWNNLTLALIQLGLSLVLAVVVAYISFNLFRYFLVKRYKIALNNVSFAILSGTVMLAVAHILSGIIQPTLSVIRTLNDYSQSGTDFILKSLFYILLFIGLGFTLSFLAISLGLYLFTILTRQIHELEEISKDNKAVGILTSVIIIVIAIFIKDSTVFLLEALIPYPTLPVKN